MVQSRLKKRGHVSTSLLVLLLAAAVCAHGLATLGNEFGEIIHEERAQAVSDQAVIAPERARFRLPTPKVGAWWSAGAASAALSTAQLSVSAAQALERVRPIAVSTTRPARGKFYAYRWGEMTGEDGLLARWSNLPVDEPSTATRDLVQPALSLLIEEVGATFPTSAARFRALEVQSAISKKAYLDALQAYLDESQATRAVRLDDANALGFDVFPVPKVAAALVDGRRVPSWSARRPLEWYLHALAESQRSTRPAVPLEVQTAPAHAAARMAHDIDHLKRYGSLLRDGAAQANVVALADLFSRVTNGESWSQFGRYLREQEVHTRNLRPGLRQPITVDAHWSASLGNYVWDEAEGGWSSVTAEHIQSMTQLLDELQR